MAGEQGSTLLQDQLNARLAQAHAVKGTLHLNNRSPTGKSFKDD